MPTPRAYQDALANHTTRALWAEGKRRVIWCLPVGAGKTFCAEILIKRMRAADWAAVYYFAHTSELVTQPGDRLDAAGVDFGYVWSGAGAEGIDALAGVQVGTVQTATRRDLAPIPRLDGAPHRRCVVFVDEAHRVRSTTYHALLDRLARLYEIVYMVLMTATPYRRDGRGLADVADALVEATTPREGFDEGWLVDPVVYSRPAPQTESDEETASQAVMSSGIVGDIVETWRAHGEGRPTIARCVNRAHARDVAARFRASGFRAEHIDGTMSLAARSVLLARLAFGGAESASPLGLDVLCSGGPMLEEGFDSAASYRHVLASSALWSVGDETVAILDRVASLSDEERARALAAELHGSLSGRRAGVDDAPPVYRPLGCLVDAAPSSSRGAWIQRMGRVCRTFGPSDVAAWDARGVRAEEKRGAIVLCHSGNLERHGYLIQHEGFRLTGDLAGATKVRANAYPSFRPPQTVSCPACFATVQRGALACPVCGAESEAVSAPQLPDERSDVKLERKRWDPSSLPPATPQEREAYLTAKWAEWRRRNEERAMRGQPPLKRGWPSVQFKVRFGEYPDWGMCNAIGRRFGAGNSA